MTELLIEAKELSNREIEVLALLAEGANSIGGSTALHISRHTFKTHVLSIHKKLGVPTNAAAVAVGFKQGYLR